VRLFSQTGRKLRVVGRLDPEAIEPHGNAA
jgi:hypothetical protein